MIKKRAKRVIVSTGLAILIALFAVHGRADEERTLKEDMGERGQELR